MGFVLENTARETPDAYADPASLARANPDPDANPITPGTGTGYSHSAKVTELMEQIDFLLKRSFAPDRNAAIFTADGSLTPQGQDALVKTHTYVQDRHDTPKSQLSIQEKRKVGEGKDILRNWAVVRNFKMSTPAPVTIRDDQPTTVNAQAGEDHPLPVDQGDNGAARIDPQRPHPTGIDPDPDDPRHHYDYRAAHAAGAEPEHPEDGTHHWPSEFKSENHPNSSVEGIDTITSESAPDRFVFEDQAPAEESTAGERFQLEDPKIDEQDPEVIPQGDEKGLYQKTDQFLAKAVPAAMHYTGMEGLGRLWDLPANVGYGMWEGGKKILKGDVKEGLKEPLRAAKRTLSGEGYYGLEEAGLPAPENPTGRFVAETAWQIGKNPLNFLVPYKQYRNMKLKPPGPVSESELLKAGVKRRSAEETPNVSDIDAAFTPAEAPPVHEVKPTQPRAQRIGALLDDIDNPKQAKAKPQMVENAGTETAKMGEAFDNVLDPLKSESGSVEVSLEPIKNTIESLEDSPSFKSAKEKISRTKKGLVEAFSSPEEVFKRDQKTGPKIYKLIDHADQKKNAFLAQEGDELVKVSGKIKEGSLSSVRVGMALDGKLKSGNLTQTEAGLYEFLKGKFDFLIQKYARSVSESEEGYLRVLRASNDKYATQVKVSQLSEENSTLYNRFKISLQEIRKGRPLKELSKQETEKYWNVRDEMRGILHREWRETLTPGEKKAHDILSRRIKEYLPHIFDNDELLSQFRQEATGIRKKLETATNQGAITNYKNRLRMLDDAIVKMQKGQMVTYDALPRNVRFRFFESRKGKAGYSFDGVKAYQTYLHGIGRKIFDEPAIRQVSDLHKELDPSLKSYNKWFIRRYMGWGRHDLDDMAGTIASFEWMRTLGANPRSAIVNLTQRINTIAEIGGKHSLKGEKLAFTKQGKELFDSTGIAQEIPTVLMEGSVPEGMEKARAILGYMFNKVELGNRRHAFLSGYSKALEIGMPEKEAIQYGIDIVHKTQFRYGKVGMPKALTHPAGRLAMQFWSYPIKQIELMRKWAKKEPLKLVKYLAMAEGGNIALNEFLGIDLSNALGFGLNWSEAIKAIRDVPDADWRGMIRHLKLTFATGGGLLPSGLGPSVSGAGKVIDAMGKGRGWEQFKKEMTPVQWKRFNQAYDSIINRKGDLYPVYDSRDHLMYYVTAKDLALRTLGPRPAKESKAYLEWRRESLLEQERKEVLKEITAAIVEGDMETADKLIEKYQVVPGEEAIKNEILKRNLSKDERKTLKRPGAKEIYRETREGATIYDKAHEAATSPLNDTPEPTAAQIEAGNYRKGHITWNGLDISIENPKGSIRTGSSPEGKKWASTLKHHYGYLRRTESKDGDPVDIFMGPDPESDTVYIIDQVDPENGRFDEPKVMLGFKSEAVAKSGYLASYEKGWKGLGAITPMKVEGLKLWLKGGNPKKPVGKLPDHSGGPETIRLKPDGTPYTQKGVELVVKSMRTIGKGVKAVEIAPSKYGYIER